MFSRNFLLLLLLCATVTQGLRCSEYIDNLDKCLDRIHNSDNFKKLRAAESTIIQGCLKQKNDCPISDSKACQDSAKTDTRTVLPAKQKMFSEIDSCFGNGQMDVFAALRQMGGNRRFDSGTKWGRSQSRSNSGGRVVKEENDPFTTPFSPFAPDTSTLPSFDPNLLPTVAPSDPSAPVANCPGTDGTTDQGGLGGSTIDNSASNLVSPTDFFNKIFNLNGATGGDSGGPVNPLSWFATLFNQGRKKRQTANQQDAKKVAASCKPVLQCIENGHKTYSARPELIAAAKAVHADKQKCSSDPSTNPPFECSTTTKDQKSCVAAARGRFQQVMKAYLTSCKQ